jgi:hypothetical protein
MAVKEKGLVLTLRGRERNGSGDTVQTVHQDGSIDLVERNRRGDALHQMPKGHFHSVQLVGTMIMKVLLI